MHLIDRGVGVGGQDGNQGLLLEVLAVDPFGLSRLAEVAKGPFVLRGGCGSGGGDRNPVVGIHPAGPGVPLRDPGRVLELNPMGDHRLLADVCKAGRVSDHVQQTALSFSSLGQDVLMTGGHLGGKERLTVGPANCDRPLQVGQLRTDHSAALLLEDRQGSGFAVREDVYPGRDTDLGQRQTEIENGCTAADSSLPLGGIRDWQQPLAIQVQFEAIRGHPEGPRLRVVQRRGPAACLEDLSQLIVGQTKRRHGGIPLS